MFQASVKITMGFAKEAPILGIFGFNVYHKNRLIMVIFIHSNCDLACWFVFFYSSTMIPFCC